ncbi:MAG TPA: M20/M25/M40 family metallo-hydrolase [Gemmatimonadaceae bacterium]|nr:M20/M25/M40 family metallo-hydrolase [Gemmatimonadaceae bacterium]
MPPALVLTAVLAQQSAAAQQPPAGARVRAQARVYREHNEAAILGEFATLLAIPNLASDSANIRRNADRLIEMLSARGFRNTRLLSVPGAPPAVYGELPSPGATRTLVLYAHYDGQPLDPKQWASPPWSPVLRDRPLDEGGKEIPLPAPGAAARIDPESRLYARSAGDDKASIIAMLTAIDAMRSTHVEQSVNIKVFFEGEEEAGSGHLRRILETYATLLAGDAWLFCDGPVHPSGRPELVFGDRGVTGLELTIYGPSRALHSGHYGNWAPNPATLIANLIASMRDDEGHIKIAGYYDDVRPISAAERKAIAALPPYDETLRHALGLARTEANDANLAERTMLPALNVRGIRVGGVRETGSNTIATAAYASFDLRLVPNQTPERVQRLVEAHIRQRGYFIVHDSATLAVRLAHPRVARVEWESGYPPSRAPLDGPFGRAVLETLNEGAKEPFLALPTSGGSGPAYLFEQVLHVPMISLPIANYDDNQHAANENLRIQNLWDGIETYVALLAGIGDRWGARPVP